MTEETSEITEEHPRKRARLFEPEGSAPILASDGQAPEAIAENKTSGTREDEELRKELRSGITAFVNPGVSGFSGVLKQRYTDFLVNEILPSGQVLHLDSTEAPKRASDNTTDDATKETTTNIKAVEPESTSLENGKNSGHDETVATIQDDKRQKEPIESSSTEIAPEDLATLHDIFGQTTTKSIQKLYRAVLSHPGRKRRDFISVSSPSIDDKDTRTRAHQSIRRIFSSRLETTTARDNSITISAAPPPSSGNNGNTDRSAGPGRMRGKLGWAELGGEFLHFSLLKENKDTMEIMYHLASQLKLHVRNFQFAGTKDRRGITVQRVSASRVHADRLAAIGKSLRGARLGGFKYEPTPLALGLLTGNDFCITLRDCHFPGEDGLDSTSRLDHAKTLVQRAVEEVSKNGFINYYGLQRFGSFSTGTDEVGMKLLQGDLKGAVELILGYSEDALAAAHDASTSTTIPSDDRNRALALHTWETTGSAQKALALMPKKFPAEISIIRYLGTEKAGRRLHERDWQGSLSSIQRGLRLMYVHAYQSLVWNVVAGKRWETFGAKVAPGDLVIIPEAQQQEDEAEVDELGEAIVRPAEDDRAATFEDHVRARPVTEEEAQSGKYSVWDVVLPLPGYDVVYPNNEIGSFYEEFMSSERGGRLNPHDMRRNWRDISLSGGYRKVLARPDHMDWEVKRYHGENEQLVETDFDRLNHTQTPRRNEESKYETEDEEPADRIAVILKMQLGSSQYATMALRELMKSRGMRPYKADFAR